MSISRTRAFGRVHFVIHCLKLTPTAAYFSFFFFSFLKNFLLEDIDGLQWKLKPPLEGEDKDEVDINEMLTELQSYAQRIEDLAIEVKPDNPAFYVVF